MSPEQAQQVMAPEYEAAAWAEYQRAVDAHEPEFAQDLLLFFARRRDDARTALAWAPEAWVNPPPAPRLTSHHRRKA